jgi:hypothetical protein
MHILHIGSKIMKPKRILHVLLLTVMAWLLVLAGVAGATSAKSLTADTVKLNLAASTTFAIGESFYLLVKVNDATDVAGATLTVEYDSTLFDVDETNVSGEAYFIAASNTFLQVTDTRTPPGTPASATPSLGNMGTAGKVMLSGAYVNPATGGGAYTGEQVIFKIKFKVKAVGNAVFTLKQSQLFNPAAGWGVAGGSAVAAPVLVGAVNQSHADWSDLTKAFPVLLGDTANPFTNVASSSVTLVTGTNVTGTITYTGKQEGVLNVTAFSDANCTSMAGGTGYQIAWPGSSQAYSVNIPATSGSYYICAFIDSGTPDGTKSATEAYGKTAAIDISGAVTGKDFALSDPDVNANGLPDWWEVKYGLYSVSSPISASADYDHDGYSNLVEYQSYVNTANQGKNPTVQDAPGGTGYDASLDTRSYTISGTISYPGSQTGMLRVAAYAPTDTTFSTPIGTGEQKTWSGTSMTYTVTVPNGAYVVAAFIDVDADTVRDTAEPQGASAQATVAGAAVTGTNFTLNDATTKKQQVFAANNPAARAGGTFSLEVKYSTLNGVKTLSGLGLRVHFNSSKMTYTGNSNLFTYGNQAGVQIQNDTANYDGDASTDKFALIAWVDTNVQWPGTSQTLPLTLVKLNFTVAGGLADGDTSMIRFSASSLASGYTLQSTPATFTVRSFNLDVDGNGAPDALTDGLLIIRYLFGFTGDPLIGNAVGDGAARSTAEAIEAYLGEAGTAMDVDGNGTPDALTDGLLIIRYLFGFTGDPLIGNAVGDGAARSTAEAIETYLQGLMP